MQTQNYKTHRRWVPLYHFCFGLIAIACLVVSIRMVYKNWNTDLRNLSILLSAISISLLLIYWYAREFAIKAQDRAIRAEENLRHFVLTGKLLDSRLRMGQIVALRFASDTEFLLLAQKAADDNLSGDAIKQSIVNWKEDNDRA